LLSAPPVVVDAYEDKKSAQFKK